MQYLPQLFENNRAWADARLAEDPGYFQNLAAIQKPEFLWIGCSDSRVAANQITGLKPGEVFVHRNIGNVLVHSDLNALSVIQYAVDVLGIKHIIVCGHYGCGGVRAALLGQKNGLVDNWTKHIEDVRNQHAELLAGLPDENARWDRLCELNVLEQVSNVCRSSVVRQARDRGQELVVHGWIYGLKDGLLRDLMMTVRDERDLFFAYQNALRLLSERPAE